MPERETPKFTGVTTHRDRMGRFAVRFPTDWQQHEVEGREGLMWTPSPDDPDTFLAVWVEELPHRVVAEDLRLLRKGVREGLAGADVEESSDVVLENLIKFERVFTRDGRKRKEWLLYVDKWLIVLTWQGSTPEEFDHWEAMANYSFATFEIPPGLWFAVDRSLARKA